MTDVVIVIGVARSGTSCVSGMLAALGVDFDDGALLEPTAFNPKGYFESSKLNGLLDGQIQSQRKGARQTADTPLTDPVKQYLYKRVLDWAPPAPIGIKDTRLVTCGAPIVEHFLGRGLGVRVVVTSRGRAANARSLESWHKTLEASRLSGFLNDHLRKTTRELRSMGVPMLHVPYEGVLKNPEHHAHRLTAFIGAPIDRVEHAASFVDPSLNHHGKGNA